MKIIFLDIDGVLNSQRYFVDSFFIRKSFNKKDYQNQDINDQVREYFLEINTYNLQILKEIIDVTGAKVVVTSSWKRLKIYPLIEKKLIEYGIPIIGITLDESYNRGEGIRRYLETHEVSEYVVIDDEIFSDYDEEILKRLVKTSFSEYGLEEDGKAEAVKILTKNYSQKGE